MSSKKPIGEFGKIFDYLQNPELRQKETGDALITINSASFGSAEFHGQAWRNIRFVDCDFASSYALKLKGSEDLQFDSCRFGGILGFGKMTRVQFSKCAGVGKLNLIGDQGSTKVRFEDCKFQGDDADQNHFGALGAEGETEFTRCQFKYMSIYGDTKLTIRDCQFENVDCPIDAATGGSEVLIENSKLRGNFDMRPAAFLSLTIRNTVIDNIDLSEATVKGDVLMESLDAGYVNALFGSAASLTIRNSQIKGNGRDVFQTSPAKIVRIDIDNVTFGKAGEAVFIGGGFSSKKEIARVNQSLRLHNCKIPVLASNHINTANLILDNCAIQEASFKESRISRLDIKNTKILERLDFTNTQVETQDLTTLAPYKGRVDKLDGSNVKLPG
ncbi:right-handed parallel beta-helix repeat-containing protein [Collimonas fungivorans]|uniref:right-handed parallel beta-helix repeat-containing protein n=1 Tax=Collimonas fungivorans TaxID=158899 RepID=UPI003FA34846